MRKRKNILKSKNFLRPCLKEEGFYKTPNWHIITFITFTLMRELTQILTASLYLHKYDCPQPMRALHLGMCTRNCQVCFHSRESIHHSVQHIRRYLRGYIFKIIDFSMVQYCSATLWGNTAMLCQYPASTGNISALVRVGRRFYFLAPL